MAEATKSSGVLIDSPASARIDPVVGVTPEVKFPAAYFELNTKTDSATKYRIPAIGLGVYQSDSGEETENAVLWALQAGYRHSTLFRLFFAGLFSPSIDLTTFFFFFFLACLGQLIQLISIAMRPVLALPFARVVFLESRSV